MKQTIRILLVLILGAVIVSCSKTSQKNYAKVKTGMSLEDVVKILGQPNTTESTTISGIAGTSAVWKTAQAEIDMQFLNDQLTVKSYSKIEDDETEFD